MFSSFERFDLELTLEQAQSASHSGRCDDDVDALAREPGVAAQLAALDPRDVRAELREYGCWEDDDLADHAENLLRVLWLAAGQIVEEAYEAQHAA